MMWCNVRQTFHVLIPLLDCDFNLRLRGNICENRIQPNQLTLGPVRKSFGLCKVLNEAVCALRDAEPPFIISCQCKDLNAQRTLDLYPIGSLCSLISPKRDQKI